MFVSNYTIGSDIELFLVDKNTGDYINAEGIIKGTKDIPYRFDESDPYYATSLDNTSAEFNIPPVTSAHDFYLNVQKCINYINSTIPDHLATTSEPCVEFKTEQLMSDTAWIVGCDKSLNCWNGSIIKPTLKGDNFRANGLHIHVGYDSPKATTNIKLAKAMDLFLGVPAVLIEPKNRRKRVGYGKAGNYRPQKHGVEYRTLSSYFSSNQGLLEWCYNNTIQAINFVNEGRSKEITFLGDIVQDTINKEVKKYAQSLISQFQIQLP